MRKIYLLLFLLLPLSSVFAQDVKAPPPPPPHPPQMPAAEDAPYRTNPTLPAFNILLPDSLTTVNTFNATEGRPTIIIVFMPDCEHCMRFTKEMLSGIDSLKKINIYMVTPMGPGLIKEFADKFNIAKYKNIIIGKDAEYTAMGLFRNQFVPFIVVYDKDKKLVTEFENTASATELFNAAYNHIPNPNSK